MFNTIRSALGMSKVSDTKVEEQLEMSEAASTAIDTFYEDYAQSTSAHKELPEPIITGNLESDLTLMIVDDQEVVFCLYSMDFDEIKTRFGIDTLSKFKIVQCGGQDAGAIASKYIAEATNEIVIAVLDLTLGTVVREPSGKLTIYDGVDLALELIKLHHRCKIGFCTAHMLVNNNPTIVKLINKFKTSTGHNLLDYTFSKNSDRAKNLHELMIDAGDSNYAKYSTDGDE